MSLSQPFDKPDYFKQLRHKQNQQINNERKAQLLQMG